MQEFPDEMIVNRVEGPTLRSFHKLLSALDSLEQWGLDQVPTSEGELWLCEEHAKDNNGNPDGDISKIYLRLSIEEIPSYIQSL
jgi:hypothetical protein